MKRVLLLLSALAPLAMAACSDPAVYVEASISDEATAERRILADLPVRFLPYNRDAIFDSLEAASPEPEPAIPPEILQQQEQVQQAQTEWRQAEERWTQVRDSLRTLSEGLQRMQAEGLRGTPQYRNAFEQFGRLEGEENRVNQQMQQAFARFDQLQRDALARSDSIRVVRETWAERAFADFDQVVQARTTAAGREEVADTTDSQGMIRVRVPSGQWWVYARYTLPYSELYWNIPVNVEGDSTHVTLNRENAEVRPVF